MGLGLDLAAGGFGVAERFGVVFFAVQIALVDDAEASERQQLIYLGDVF